MNAVTFDPAAAQAWLQQTHQHPGKDRSTYTLAEMAGIDEESFGRYEEGFLSLVEDGFVDGAAGFAWRGDTRGVELWLIPDGDALDRGAVITVDLTNGVRLATLHQDRRDFADRDARGIPALLSALAHIADQVTRVVEDYERSNPHYQPPAISPPQ